MKKEYIAPQMEVVEIKNECQILAGSVQNASGNVFDGIITGSNEPGRAPELDVFFNDLDLE